MKKEEVKRNLDFRLKTGNPSLFTDVMKFYNRTDGHCVMCFGDSMIVKDQEGKEKIEAYEQARIIVTKDHAREIANVICRNLDHYPVKQKSQKEDKD